MSISRAPTISVIVVNWNGKHFLDVCLSSLRAQNFTNFETILVDNGSQDGSVDFVQQHFPEVRVIALKTNSGFAGGNIAGYQQACGDLVVLLNNDTRAHPDWLSQIEKASRQFPEAGSFACKMLYFDEPSRIENCGFDLTPSGATADLGRDEPDGAPWTTSRSVFGACGGAAAYRRRTLEEVGFFDPTFFLIYEDVDLAFRAQLRGLGCIFLPEAVVYHRYRSSIGSLSAQHVFYSQRNIEMVYLKNMPWPLMLRSLPHRFLYEVGSALYFTKLGLRKPYLSGKVAALRLLPSILRERRKNLKKKSVSNAQLLGRMTAGHLASKWNKFRSLWMTPRTANGAPKASP